MLALHFAYLIPYIMMHLNGARALIPAALYAAYIVLKIAHANEKVLRVLLVLHVAAVFYSAYMAASIAVAIPLIILPYFLYTTTTEVDDDTMRVISILMTAGAVGLIAFDSLSGAPIISEVVQASIVVAGTIYIVSGYEGKKAASTQVEVSKENKELSKQVRQLQAKIAEQKADDRASNYLSVILGLEFSGFSEEESIERVIKTIDSALHPIFCGYYVADNALKSFALSHSTGQCKAFGKREEFGIGFVGETYNTKHFSYISSLQEMEDEYQRSRLNGVNCALTFPVVLNDKVIGTFVIGVGVMSEKEEQTIANLCAIISDKVNIEFGKIQDHKTVTDKAITDKLTGLYNRLYFEEMFPKEFEKAKEEGKSIAYILIDLDYFKQMNDTHGHDFGDKVLKTAARTFKENIRSADYAFRTGGDEFSLVLLGASPEAARHVATKIAKAYEEKVEAEHLYAKKDGVPVKSSFSIGIAVYPNVAATTAQDLVKTADNAVYFVKEHGKNSIAVAKDK